MEMNFFIDFINTVIQVFIMTYIPYFILTTDRVLDEKVAKKKFIVSGVSILIMCTLYTTVLCNSNLSSTLITMTSLLIIYLSYGEVYKKALVAYSLAYLSIQFVTILVTSIMWPVISEFLPVTNTSRILGIYLPAIVLELLIIKGKNALKLIYEYVAMSKKSLELGFLLIVSMDLVVSFSMIINEWNNVFMVNITIIMAAFFIVGISIYMNNLHEKYEEINRLNMLLMEKNNELKKIKHDYGAQISYINGLYIMNQYERLGEILKSIINGNSEVSPYVKSISNTNSLISSVVESIDLKDTHIVIDEEIDSNLIDINEYDFHKILSNLLRNAVTALNGRGLIVIRTYKIFNSIYVSVKNNGPQIDPDIIDTIFDAGFTTKKNKNGSSGYGLNIVRETVENNNGKLYVHSDDKYTEFKIVFLQGCHSNT